MHPELLKTLENKSEEELKQLKKLLEANEYQKTYRYHETVFTDYGDNSRDNYKKHVDFLDAGAFYPWRAFKGGNRSGKTHTLGYECARHLCLDYPDWWRGRVFHRATVVWVVGVTTRSTKDALQKVLLGQPLGVGGMIPKEYIKKIIMAPGGTGQVQEAHIGNKLGSTSILGFKSVEQGKDTFQAVKLDVLWLDEDSGNNGILSEGSMRLVSTNKHEPPGLLMCSFTPLKGFSETFKAFPEGGDLKKGTFSVTVTWDDVPHMTEEEKEREISKMNPRERACRTLGVPLMGAGAVYVTPEHEIAVKPFAIPDHWPRAYGLDPGWNATAAVWLAINPDDSSMYLYSEYKTGQQLPPYHVENIKSKGDWIPGIIDIASRGTETDGIRVVDKYIDLGLNVTPGERVGESGVTSVSMLLESGQLKVMSHLNQWFSEYRTYHRNENTGKIAENQDDHLMDATKYAIMFGPRIAIAKNYESFRDSFYLSSRDGVSSVTGY